MLFHSAEYLVLFLPLCLLLFSAFRSPAGRVASLLVLSLYFYMVAYPAYIVVLLGLIGFDFGAGLWINRTEGPARKRVLALALVANVGLLAVFKYYNFFAENLNWTGLHLPLHHWILPVGLSFHTFQSMSYLIEVFRKTHPCETSLPKFALYVLFFPQMVAGPIERPQNILPQFSPLPAFAFSNLKPGLFQFVRGLWMKVAVADVLTEWVDAVFRDPGQASAAQAWMAMLFFGIQIYADFSGYSNMALGTARMLGIDLMVNFRQPYLATSLSDFWRRWHISLSTWFRDYVYIPLGGNRNGPFQSVRNLFLVFSLSGLWHGAGWNFVVWGVLHGLAIAVESFGVRKPGSESRPWLGWIRTQAWVFFCWVFFRATSFENAIQVLKAAFSDVGSGLSLSPVQGGYGIGLCVLVLLAERFSLQESAYQKLGWIWMAILGLTAYFLGNYQSNSFIYFQF
jgi:alginate O-acetyltransferase complex protein AlgI